MPHRIVHNLQEVFNTFNFGILIEDADRKVLYVNTAFRSIFDIPGEFPLLGINCMNIAASAKFFFKDPDKFENDIHAIPEALLPHDEVVESGSGFFYRRKYHPVFENGNVVAHIWNYEDITALRLKEAALSEQKDFYHKILNEIPADIAIFDAAHRYLYLNKTAIKNPELREWIIGKDDYEYCDYRNRPRSTADERRQKFDEAITARKTVSWVDKFQTPDRKPDYVLRNFYPYVNKNGEIELVIGYGVNITNEKVAEQRAEYLLKRFRWVMETLNEGVFQMTLDHRMEFVNESFKRMMYLGKEDVVTELDDKILRNLVPADMQGLIDNYLKLVGTKEPQKGIFRINDPVSGDMRYIDYNIWMPPITDNTAPSVAGRLLDITESVQKERNMRKMISKEKELNNLKSDFIHITSHELRTPLSVILSSAEILEMVEAMGDEGRRQLDTTEFTANIGREVRNITGILDHLLMVGQIENGKLKFEPAPVFLPDYIADIIAEYYSPYTDGRSVKVEIEPGVGEAYIDAKMMRHTLENILNNALKYSAGKPPPEMSIYISGKDKLVFRVKDFGIGIPKEDINRLFHSFYRASNVGNISGTGIGLILVEYSVKAHKGDIKIDSEPGAGTTFTISIPYKKK